MSFFLRFKLLTQVFSGSDLDEDGRRGSTDPVYTVELLQYKKVVDILIDYSRILNAEPQNLFLLYKGQILNNYDNLSTLQLENQHVYLVHNNCSTPKEKPLSETSQILDIFRDIMDQFDSSSLEDIIETQNVSDNIDNTSDSSDEEEEELSIDSTLGDSDNHGSDMETAPDSNDIVNTLVEPEVASDAPSEGSQILNELNQIIARTQEQLASSYPDEVSQLQDMGFTNQAQNQEALFIFEGNLELAINYLVQLEQDSASE